LAVQIDAETLTFLTLLELEKSTATRMNISVLETGMATVKSPAISFNCTGREDGGSLNLAGSPIVFSGVGNVFMAVGCDTQAFMKGIEPKLVGCEPTCGHQQNNVSLQDNNVFKSKLKEM